MLTQTKEIKLDHNLIEQIKVFISKLRDKNTTQNTGSFTLNANRGIALNAGGGTILTSTGSVLGYNGIIAGSNALTVSGSGELTLGRSNTNSGAVNINSGTLALSSIKALGDASSTTVVD